MMIERKWKKWVYFYVPMALFIVFTLLFYWMAVTAFRPDGALPPGASRTPPLWTLEPPGARQAC